MLCTNKCFEAYTYQNLMQMHVKNIYGTLLVLLLIIYLPLIYSCIFYYEKYRNNRNQRNSIDNNVNYHFFLKDTLFWHL